MKHVKPVSGYVQVNYHADFLDAPLPSLLQQIAQRVGGRKKIAERPTTLHVRNWIQYIGSWQALSHCCCCWISQGAGLIPLACVSSNHFQVKLSLAVASACLLLAPTLPKLLPVLLPLCPPNRCAVAARNSHRSHCHSMLLPFPLPNLVRSHLSSCSVAQSAISVGLTISGYRDMICYDNRYGFSATI